MGLGLEHDRTTWTIAARDLVALPIFVVVSDTALMVLAAPTLISRC